jgi:hypothetical protein
MPELRDTGRHYREETRPRLASHGLERFAPAKRRNLSALLVAGIIAAGVIAALAWFSHGR